MMASTGDEACDEDREDEPSSFESDQEVIEISNK